VLHLRGTCIRWGWLGPSNIRFDFCLILWRPIFYFFLTKISHYSGTTTSRSANIRYTFHNMYLIIKVTSMQWITHNSFINIVGDTSINNIWLRQKSQWCIYLFKDYYYIVIKDIPKDWLINTSVTGDMSHKQILPKRWTTHSPTITTVASGIRVCTIVGLTTSVQVKVWIQHLSNKLLRPQWYKTHYGVNNTYKCTNTQDSIISFSNRYSNTHTHIIMLPLCMQFHA
jgi:hypothetical protein